MWLAVRIEAERVGASREGSDRVDALFALARAGRTGGTAAWASAVDACRSMDEAFPLAYALLRHGEALLSAGKRSAARNALAEALRPGAGHGCHPAGRRDPRLARAARLEPEARQPASTPDVPVAATDPLHEFGLTAREREVLMLIAAGRSNGQIADELVISRKTASVHVSNILAKLDVSTRVEAAPLVHRLGLTPAAEVRVDRR